MLTPSTLAPVSFRVRGPYAILVHTFLKWYENCAKREGDTTVMFSYF